MNEDTLILAAQSGNVAAFDSLVLAHQGAAYAVAYRILCNAEAAADATQDSFIKAYRKLEQYRGGSFKSWLLRIVANTCYDVLRANRRRGWTILELSEVDADHHAWLAMQDVSPEDYAINRELASAILAGIQDLSSSQRTVFVLSDIEGLTHREIAGMTGMPVGTVKSRLSRARARLRTLLTAPQGSPVMRRKHARPGNYGAELRHGMGV